MTQPLEPCRLCSGTLPAIFVAMSSTWYSRSTARSHAARVWGSTAPLHHPGTASGWSSM